MSLEDESGGSLRDPSSTFFETKSEESCENFNTTNFKSFSQTSGLTNDEESFDFSRSSPSLSSYSTIRRRSSDNESGGGSLCSANISSDEESEDSTIDDDDISTSSLSETISTIESVSKPKELKLEGVPTYNTHHIARYLSKTFLTEPPVQQDSDESLDIKLFDAAEKGDIDKIKTILKSGARVSVTDKNMRTPLHIACSLGHIHVVRLLVNYGCNVDACSMTKQTPLHEACIGGHDKVIQLLLPEVADLDYVDHNGQSAAHYCALQGEVKCLNLLCTQGCDICLEDSMNRTGVHFAAMNNHPDIIQLLMERGAELDTVDKDGKTPAHYAAKHGSVQSLAVLLKSAVDITQGDTCGCLPLHEAAYYDKFDCLKMLIKKGAKSSLCDDKGRNALHKAAQGKAIRCLHWLVTTGRLDINTKDYSGNTGLHHAAAGGHPEVYYCLLQHGADSELCNNSGDNPLDIARKHGKRQAISKAVDRLIKCKFCSEEEKKRESQNLVSSSSIHLKINGSKESLFKLPTSSARLLSDHTQFKKGKVTPDRRSITKDTSSHFILATKYYGPAT